MDECRALVQLDRRLSRALEIGRAIWSEAAELELLAALGILDQLATAKSQALTAAAIARRKIDAAPATSEIRLKPAAEISSLRPDGAIERAMRRCRPGK